MKWMILKAIQIKPYFFSFYKWIPIIIKDEDAVFEKLKQLEEERKAKYTSEEAVRRGREAIKRRIAQKKAKEAKEKEEIANKENLAKNKLDEVN